MRRHWVRDFTWAVVVSFVAGLLLTLAGIPGCQAVSGRIQVEWSFHK
jgi:hypothetical protein